MILVAFMLLAADPSFADKAAQVKPGVALSRVRELLGEPERSADTAVWSYKDPPNQTDGPYTWYRITFAKGKVSKVETGGVVCVYRK